MDGAVAGDGGAFVDALDGGPLLDRCYSDPVDTPPGLANADC